ncbi:MAG: A/G-specific adenine glycosylase [Bacteroidota bacterium]
MKFVKKLLSWYSDNQRDLPWRRTKDPYLIWLSEIIMQQTRVEQGTPYYQKFADTYPTIQDLAAADEQEVLKLWQGLGYYSRARNLHATAQTVTKEHGGKFPDTYAGILKLKGIGDYTAAAIASICFNLPYPVMDGNVLRFLSRVHGIAESIDLPSSRKKILQIATEMIDHTSPGDFNQAMMEFGALVCTPANPGCKTCIFNKQCIAFKIDRVDEIPQRNVKASVRERFMHYLVVTVTHQGTEFIYLNKRTGRDIWKNMYDFPCMEFSVDDYRQCLQTSEFNGLLNFQQLEFRQIAGPYVHLLTHQKLIVRFYRFHSDKMIKLPYTLIPLTDIHQYPVPKLIDRYLSEKIQLREDR